MPDVAELTAAENEGDLEDEAVDEASEDEFTDDDVDELDKLVA